jgi:hypothetical protein
MLNFHSVFNFDFLQTAVSTMFLKDCTAETVLFQFPTQIVLTPTLVSLNLVIINWFEV